jgi:hypothetical protein
MSKIIKDLIIDKEIVDKEVEKFLNQVGVEIIDKEDHELLKKIYPTYPDDKLYGVWKSSLVRFVEKIIKLKEK